MSAESAKWHVRDDRYPACITDERPTDAEVDAMIAELAAAGILTVGTDAEGRETWTLTEMGTQLGRQMAMSTEDDALALLDARTGCEGTRPTD